MCSKIRPLSRFMPGSALGGAINFANPGPLKFDKLKRKRVDRDATR